MSQAVNSTYDMIHYIQIAATTATISPSFDISRFRPRLDAPLSEFVGTGVVVA